MSVNDITENLFRDGNLSFVDLKLENVKNTLSLFNERMVYHKLWERICSDPELNRLKNPKWVKLHSLLAYSSIDDPKFQNTFIEGLGNRFETLRPMALL